MCTSASYSHCIDCIYPHSVHFRYFSPFDKVHGAMPELAHRNECGKWISIGGKKHKRFQTKYSTMGSLTMILFGALDHHIVWFHWIFVDKSFASMALFMFTWHLKLWIQLWISFKFVWISVTASDSYRN